MITNWHGILWARLSLGRTNTLIRVNTSYNAFAQTHPHTHTYARAFTSTNTSTPMYVSITRAFVSYRINARIYGWPLSGLINFTRPRVTNFPRFLWFERHLRRLCGGFELMNATAAIRGYDIAIRLSRVFRGRWRSEIFKFARKCKRRVQF